MISRLAITVSLLILVGTACRDKSNSKKCVKCKEIYDSSCQGIGVPDLLTGCPTAKELGVEYSKKVLVSGFDMRPNACKTQIKCPSGFVLYVNINHDDVFSGLIAYPSNYAWCEESGLDAGQWFIGNPVYQFKINSTICKSIEYHNANLEERETSEEDETEYEESPENQLEEEQHSEVSEP